MNNFEKIKTPEELLSFMEKNIEYGYVDKQDNKHYEIGGKMGKIYKLQSPEELLKSKLGVCWDQVELERLFFEKNNIDFSTYFIVYYDGNMYPTHTFLTYKSNNEYIWFEHSWKKHKGLHKFNSIHELLREVKKIFTNEEIEKNYNIKNLCIYKYEKPTYNISCIEFYNHCEKGINIKI